MSEYMYSYVVDHEGKQLSPTKEVKAWYMIRKGKAVLVSKYPMCIKLMRVIPENEICKDEVRFGIDDGSLYTGIAVVQAGKKYNKVLLKGTIEHRKDVKKKMELRKIYRQHRRYYKRYREERFNNRTSHKRSTLAPSIKQKKQAILRVVDNINKFVHVDSYYLEDVKIDIRAFTDGYKPYKWQYQKSNRLDSNLRMAAIMRDKCTCQLCGKEKKNVEVHHILPRRLNGEDTISNLVTLCHKCHEKVTGKETKYIKYFHDKIGNKSGKPLKGLLYASHVMIGKKYLQSELKNRGNLFLTCGGDTCNKRSDWKIEKTHANDAICITDLKPRRDTIDIRDWTIKPIRRQSKAKHDNVLGIKHRDYIRYTRRDGISYEGYVASLHPDKKLVSFQSTDKYYGGMPATRCKKLWCFNRLMWL